MTTEVLESLIEDPDAFALGIDSAPIRDVIVEIATRVDALQYKLTKSAQETNSNDTDQIREINVHLNEMAKSHEQQNNDFTNEVREIRQFFQYQIKDLRETMEKNNRQTNERILSMLSEEKFKPQAQQVPTIAVKQTEHEDDPSPKRAAITDDLAIRKLTYDVQSLRDRIDSLISTIEIMKEGESKIQQISFPETDTEHEAIKVIPSDGSLKLTQLKQEDDVETLTALDPSSATLMPLKVEDQAINRKDEKFMQGPPATQADDPRINDLLARFDQFLHERKAEKEKISSITKTTNKIIIELDNQRKDITALNQQNQNNNDQFDQINQKLIEMGFDSEKKIINLKSIIDNITPNLEQQKDDVKELQKNQIIIPVTQSPDINNALQDLKTQIENNLKDVDSNFRTQIHYLKQELTNMKLNIRAISPKNEQDNIEIEDIKPPEMAQPPTFQNSPPISDNGAPKKLPNVNEEDDYSNEVAVDSPTKLQNARNVSPTFRSQVMKTSPNGSAEPQFNVKRNHNSQSTIIDTEYIDKETMTNPSELGEIPVERVSFGTPLTSLPNSIETQFIVDRKPNIRIISAEGIPLRKEARSQSVKFITVKTNTPPFDPEADGQVPFMSGEATIEIDSTTTKSVTRISRATTPVNQEATNSQSAIETITDHENDNAELKADTVIENDTANENMSQTEGQIPDESPHEMVLEDFGSDPKEELTNRATTPGKGSQFVELIDDSAQTEISVCVSMATTPIPTRQPTAVGEKRVTIDQNTTQKTRNNASSSHISPAPSPHYVRQEIKEGNKVETQTDFELDIDNTIEHSTKTQSQHSTTPNSPRKQNAGNNKDDNQEALTNESGINSQPIKTANSEVFELFENAKPEDVQFMEQYAAGGEQYVTPSKGDVGPSRQNMPDSPAHIYPSETYSTEQNYSGQYIRLPTNVHAAFVFERLLELNIMSDYKPTPAIVISAGPDSGTPMTAKEQEELVQKVADASKDQKLSQIDFALSKHRADISELQSKMQGIPTDVKTKITDLQANVRKWVENTALLHKKVSELSVENYAPKKRIKFDTDVETKNGTISIPPARAVEVDVNNPQQQSTSSAVTEPEIVIEMSKTKKVRESKPKQNMFVFSRVEMINSPPTSTTTSQKLISPTIINAVEFDVSPISSNLTQSSLLEQIGETNEKIENLKYTISRLENDLFQVAHDFEEFKSIPPPAPIIERHYHSHKSHSKDRNESKHTGSNKVKKSRKHETTNSNNNEDKASTISYDKEYDDYYDEDEQGSETTSPQPDEIKQETDTKEDVTEKTEEEKPPETVIESSQIETKGEVEEDNKNKKNVVMWQMQYCHSIFVDAKGPETKEQSKATNLDLDALVIPRYDEQIRIMRDALVDMRTNQQLLKQRTEERFQQIVQKQMMVQPDELKDPVQMNAFKKAIETKINEFEGGFIDFRQEFYQFMKDRPERIIERIKEVVVEKHTEVKAEKKKLKKKKEQKPPPPPPPPDIDIDLQIKKNKKLIGEIESPRIFNIRPIPTLASPIQSDDSESPIVEDSNKPSTFASAKRSRIKPRPSDYEESEYEDDDKPVHHKESPRIDNSVLPSETPSQSDNEGHIVPQLIDEVSVYNALPKSDYTEKLVPMLMKIRDELKVYVDKANNRTLKCEKVVKNKCDKDYVEAFFRRMRGVMQNMDEKANTLIKALPQRVTKEELNERLENFQQEIERDGYVQPGATNGNYSRCLFCGTKLPAGKTDIPNPEAVGGRPIPPRTNIVSEKGIVYKGRTSVTGLPTQPQVQKTPNPLPVMNQDPPSFLPKL